MKNSQKLAQEIKNYLIKLMVEEPQAFDDLNTLDTDKLETVIITTLYKQTLEIEQEEVTKASVLLFEEDGEDYVSLADQIKLIKQQAKISSGQLIDNISGVSPCESAQYSFTCQEFLDHIYVTQY